MKKSLFTTLVVIFIFTTQSYSCICSIGATVTYQYQTSNFVATVKILKNYKNYPDTNDHYKSDVEILNLYKGKKLKSIHILGSNGNNSYNSCGTFIAEGETRLIFGNYDKDGHVTTYLCTSYYKPLSTNYKSNNIPEKLTLLKKGKINYSLKFFNEYALYPYDFKHIYNPDLINHFSLIKLKFDKNGELLKIKYLSKETKKFKLIYDNYFRETVNWPGRLSRLNEEKGKPVTLTFEINPYTSSKPKI